MLTLMLAHSVNRNDARMVELGRRFGFLIKALHLRTRCPVAGPDHLQGHDAMKLRIPRLIHHSHASMRDLLQQFIISKRTAGSRWMWTIFRFLFLAGRKMGVGCVRFLRRALSADSVCIDYGIIRSLGDGWMLLFRLQGVGIRR